MAHIARIGLSKSSSKPELVLEFDTFDEAAAAAHIIDKGGIGRVEVETKSGIAVVWCNYVTYVVIEPLDQDE
jgi:hypothetical protein